MTVLPSTTGMSHDHDVRSTANCYRCRTAWVTARRVGASPLTSTHGCYSSTPLRVTSARWLLRSNMGSPPPTCRFRECLLLRGAAASTSAGCACGDLQVRGRWYHLSCFRLRTGTRGRPIASQAGGDRSPPRAAISLGQRRWPPCPRCRSPRGDHGRRLDVCRLATRSVMLSSLCSMRSIVGRFVLIPTPSGSAACVRRPPGR
jgi:hypothetical protein